MDNSNGLIAILVVGAVLVVIATIYTNPTIQGIGIGLIVGVAGAFGINVNSAAKKQEALAKRVAILEARQP